MAIKSPQISVTILTYNSEKTIEQCLDSLIVFDDIVVIDSGSTDRTLALLEAYPTVTVVHHDWQGYAAQKSFALRYCRHDWVLNIDSDESVDANLVDALITMTQAQADQVDGIRFGIHEHFLGRPNHRWTRANKKIRCFKKSKSTYSDHLVHEGVCVQGCVIDGVGLIHHYGEHSHEIKVDKINRYSSLKASETHDASWMLLLKLLTIFPIAFFRSYILRRQCLNGVRGFSASMINAFYAFLKYAKCYENTVTEASS